MIEAKVVDYQVAPYIYRTKVLKPNVTENEENIINQHFISESNTKYVIKWDYNLLGQTIIMPERCILEFDGGSFSNGKLFGDDTYLIMHQDVEDVLKNVRLEGTFKYPKQGNYSDSEELNEIVQQAVQDACTNNETLEQIISNIIFNQLNIEVSEVTTEQIDTLFNQ